MKANHNKDYSVVKTLGCLVLLRGFFYILVIKNGDYECKTI